MCTMKDGFVLCVCADKQKDFSWILEKQDRTLPLSRIKGKALNPYFSENEQQEIAFVITELNKRNCFDFSYTKQEGDVLSLKIGETLARFRVVQGVWTQDFSNSLSSWRAQMVPQKQGLIKTP